MLQELIDIVLVKNKMLFFHSTFFNMDISVSIAYRPFRFETCILEIQMEGSVSQNSFFLGNVEIYEEIMYQKLPVFFT